jgi:predicted pyridoxine 5'-phosphate oxidase superfamily flavin-nucleotide-binding protein
MDDVFHPGEIEVQERAGVRDAAAKLGPRMVAPGLDATFAEFLSGQFLLVAGGRDHEGHVWASALVGPRGFAQATSPQRLLLHVLPGPGDPLLDALDAGDVPLGLFALDAMTRGRIRVNGTARRVGDEIEVAVAETFGNCPKYIQRRKPIGLLNEGRPDAELTRADALDEAGRALVRAADTFYVATAHATRGADASHRGGRPGFVSVADDGTRLTFPDYQGNNMFQTLGNLTVDPAVGLLFVDWEQGTTVQVSGRGSVVWDDERLARTAGAQRLVDVEIEAVVVRRPGVPLRWELVESHRLNPEV